MRIAGVVAISLSLGLSLVSLDARADNKAWGAAKLGLPADTKVVVGLDFAALRKTQLFQALMPKLLDKADAAKGLEIIKTACKRDPVAMIHSMVIATSEDQEHGAVYVSLAGIDRAKLLSCIQAAAQGMADANAKVSVKQDGNITEINDGTDIGYLGWVGKDIVVVPIPAEDRAGLARWMSGKGALAKSTVSKKLAKINTAAALWAASDVAQEVQSLAVKGGYVTLMFAKGNVDADVHAVLENAAQATSMATATRQQLDEAKQAVLLPPAFAALLEAVTVTSASDEVVFKANVRESDLVSAVNLALAMAP